MPNRLTLIPREELPEADRRFRDAVAAIRSRPISGPFIPLLRSSPDLAARVAHLGHYFHARGQADESILSVRVRTFVALIVARTLDIPYEWDAWIGWALEAGLPQETADALRERQPLHLDAEDALVLAFTTQLLADGHRVSDSTFKAALEHFGVQGSVELACTVGYFAMLGFPLNAFEIEMSSDQKGMRKTFAPLPLDGHEAGLAHNSARHAFHGKHTASAAPRVPFIAKHDDLRRDHQHFFDRVIRTRGRAAGPFQVLLHTPDVADRVAVVGDAILYSTILAPRLKALTWLIAAREWDCGYAWAFASSRAREAGVEDDVIDAIGSGHALRSPGAEDKLLADFCAQLFRGNHHVSDASYRATVDRIGIAAAVQVAVTLGYFVMQSCVLNAFEIEPGEDASELTL